MENMSLSHPSPTRQFSPSRAIRPAGLLSQRSNSDSKAAFTPYAPPKPILSPSDRAAAFSGRHFSTDASSRPSLSATAAPSFSTSSFSDMRTLLDQQREIFEAERQLFARERLLWTTERQSLYARVEHLESALSSQTTQNLPRGTSAIRSSPSLSPTTHHVGFSRAYQNTDNITNGVTSIAPSPSDSSRRNSAGLAGPVSATEQNGHLASISETLEELDGQEHDGSGTISPQRIITSESYYGSTAESGQEPAVAESGRIDISEIDQHLDGINLKTKAIVPRASISIPQSVSPPTGLSRDRTGSLSIDQAADLPIIETFSPPAAATMTPIDNGIPSPHVRNLLMHAGHTPLSTPARPAPSSDDPTDPEATPKKGSSSSQLLISSHSQAPQAPQAPQALPSSATDPPLPSKLPEPPSDQHGDPDPALTGPLGLTNEQAQDSTFLRKLDMKLLSEAKKLVGPSRQYTNLLDEEAIESSSADEGAGTEDEGGRNKEGESRKEEPEVRLRFKRSMNFGSAFGSARTSTTV